VKDKIFLDVPPQGDNAEILGIPYGRVTQIALVPVDYTLGIEFKPAARESPDTFVHCDEW
jgi:hypothetical protein